MDEALDGDGDEDRKKVAQGRGRGPARPGKASGGGAEG